MYSKFHHERDSEKSKKGEKKKEKKSLLYWENDLRKKVKRIGTLQGGEEVREE